MVESRHKDDDPVHWARRLSRFASNIAKRLSGPWTPTGEPHVDYEPHPKPPSPTEDPLEEVPGVMVGWDNSPGAGVRPHLQRRHAGGVWRVLRRTTNRCQTSATRRTDLHYRLERVAEGNHLEPDRRYGRGYSRQPPSARWPNRSTRRPDTSVAEPADSTPTVRPDTCSARSARYHQSAKGSRDRACTPGLASAFEDAGIGYQLVTTDTVTMDGSSARTARRPGRPRRSAPGDVLEQCRSHRLLLPCRTGPVTRQSTPCGVANIAHFDIGCCFCVSVGSPDEDRLGGTASVTSPRKARTACSSAAGGTFPHRQHESIFSPRHPTSWSPAPRGNDRAAGVQPVLQSGLGRRALRLVTVPVDVEEAPAPMQTLSRARRRQRWRTCPQTCLGR